MQSRYHNWRSLIQSSRRKSAWHNLKISKVDITSGIARFPTRKYKKQGEITVELTPMELEIVKKEMAKAPSCEKVLAYICDRPRGAQRHRVKGKRYPFTASGLRRVVKNTLRKAGIDDFRHTFANRAMDAKGDVHALMVAMDHQDIKSTMRYLNSKKKKRANDLRGSVHLTRELDSNIPDMSPLDSSKEIKKVVVH